MPPPQGRCLLTGYDGNDTTISCRQTSQEEAKELMGTQEFVIPDVREQNEYDSGHIPDAVLLPVETIDANSAAAVISEKGTTVSKVLQPVLDFSRVIMSRSHFFFISPVCSLRA